MSYQLYAIRIFSIKWDQSFRFYKETLGLPLFYSDAELGWAQFDVGAAYIGLERCDDSTESAELVGRFVGISLQVNDIEATYTSLKAKGVEFTSPPEQQAWGGTLAHFKDPDGNIITLLDAKGD